MHTTNTRASVIQQSLWALSRDGADADLLVSGIGLFLRGAFDAAAARAALQSLVDRCEILRTGFTLDADGCLQQAVLPALAVQYREVDWSALPADELLRMQAEVRAAHGGPPTLQPFVELLLARLGDGGSWIHLAVPTLNADAATASMLLDDAVAAGCRDSGGPESDVEDLPYRELAGWMDEFLHDDALLEARQYWQQSVANRCVDQAFGIRRHLATDSSGRRQLDIALGAEHDRLQAFAAANGATLADLICASLRRMLARLAPDACLARVLDSRDTAQLGRVPGPLQRALPIDVVVASSLDETLRNEVATRAAASDYAECYRRPADRSADSFSFVYSALTVGRSLRRHGRIDRLHCPLENARIQFTFIEQDQHDILLVDFDHAFVDQEALRRVMADWRADLLEAVGGDSAVGSIAAIDGPRIDHTGSSADVLAWFARANRDGGVTLIAPGAPALGHQALDARANALAHCLLDHGITRGDRVALCMPRGIEWVIGMLAVLKAGAAYVPIDIDLPAQRIAALLADAEVQLAITRGPLADLPVAQIDCSAVDTDRYSSTEPAVAIAPEDLAYVLYTSGTTARPKGVCISHRALHNHMAWMLGAFDFDSGDVFLQRTSASFDASVWEFWAPLLLGATLVIVPDELNYDMAGMLQTLRAQRISVLQMVPSQLDALLQQAGEAPALELRYLFCGGEALPTASARAAQQRFGCEVVNLYGPTECCIQATSFRFDPRLTTPLVPIGRPIDNVSARVIAADGRPARPGEPGELYLAGACVFSGYLNQPEASAEAIGRPAGSAISHYRTGDIVRMLDDGTLYFLQRRDDQIKLHGYRIDLAGIARHAEQLGGVQKAVCVFEPQHKRLALFAQTSRDQADLLAALRATLPDYMVPAQLIAVTEWPTTRRGKLDTAALLQTASRNRPVRYRAAGSTTEAALVEIWQAQLATAEPVGIDDDFFLIGGHSLLATKVAAQIAERLGVAVTVRALFEHTTVAALAAHIDGLTPIVQAVIEAADRSRPLALSFGQQRLWFIEQFARGNVQYSMPMPLQLTGQLDRDALTDALDTIVARHEILRTVYRSSTEGEGEGEQQILPPRPLRITDVDLSGAPIRQRSERLHALLQQDAASAFDLGNDPMLRATLLRLGPDQHVLLLNLHHIAADGWSLHVLATEFAQLYAARVDGQPAALPALPLQYADFAQWQRRQLGGEHLGRQLDYWRRQLSGLPTVHAFPLDHRRPELQSHAGALHRQQIDAATSARIRQLAQAQGSSLFMTLQAAFALLIARYSGEHDIVIGTPVANRPQAALAPLIGLFLNNLVLRNDLSGDPSFVDLLQRTRGMVLDAFEHAELPFEMLVDQLSPQRSLSHSPLFQLMFTLQNNDEIAFDLPGLAIRSLPHDRGIAKYDLSLSIADGPDGLALEWEYCTALFEADTIGRIGANFAQLLHAIGDAPEAPVSSLRTLAADEHAQLARWNDTALGYVERCVHQIFERQAERTPDAVALVDSGIELSYRELDARANRLAHYLRAHGLRRGDLVGVCIERSAGMLVALLATLKAGGAYLPLDPSYPLDRLNYMLADADAKWLLTQRDAAPMFATEPNVRVLCLDEPDLAAAIAAMDADIVRVDGLSPAELAYVIYTSGSTGRPKGVMIEHRNVANFLAGLDRFFGSPDGPQTWLAVTSISFDISVLELFWTLGNGHRVVLQPERPVPVGATEPVDFSLFYFAAEDANSRNKYGLLLEGARFADQHGLAGVWIPERHFASFGDQFPNPSVAAAAVAAITTRTRIRSGSVVLPLHNPIRVAEEWSMVDNLSEGRVELSIASGWHPNDFVFAPQDYHGRHEVMRNGITTLQAFWRGEPLRRPNGVGQEVEVRLHPRPVQAAVPLWITAGGSPDTFRYAGSIGAGVLTHLLGQSMPELEEKIAIYREALAAAGHDRARGRVALMLHTLVAERIDEVRPIVEQPLKNYLRHSLGLLKPLADQAGLDFENDVDAILDIGFEHHFAGSGLFGTPESCFARIQELRAIGVDEVACLIDFGIDHATVLKHLSSLHRLQQNVRRHAAQQRLLAKRLQSDWSVPALMQQHRVTHLQCTPSYARELAADAAGQRALAGLSQLLVGGEALPPALAESLLQTVPGGLFNMYGPTETTVWSAIAAVTDGTVQLGRPMANTRFRVVGADDRLLPIGAIGELLIGGDGVARGYLGREQLTAEKFVFHRDDDTAQHAADSRVERCYRTGDLVRWSGHGQLHYIGRIDHQVKIRGHRIELGEIEAALCSHPLVTEAVVVARGEPAQLVAFVVARAGAAGAPASEVLRSHLRQSLPEIMLPSAIAFLPALPLTPNGKVDRNALPEVGSEVAVVATHVAAASAMEAALCEIWQAVLGIERVGVTDNFFNIGGDSILAIRMIARCSQQGIALTTQQLFKHQTIRELAPHAQTASKIRAPQGASEGVQALLPIHHWFLDSSDAGSRSHYNQSVLLRVPDALDLDRLRRLVEALYRRHDALRLRFGIEHGQWQARYAPYEPGMVDASVAGSCLRGQAPAEREASIASAGEAAQQSLSIAEGPLLRCVLFGADAGEQRLLIVIHHLVVDGVSWRVLLTDLEHGYRQLLEQRSDIALAPKTSSLQQWGEFLSSYALSDALHEELPYWTAQQQIAVLPLPVDHADIEDHSEATTRQVTLSLTAEETDELLTRTNRAYRTDIAELLLSGVMLGFREWAGTTALRIDLEGHGREALSDSIDHSDTLGWFTSLYPLTLQVHGVQAAGEVIMRVKEQVRSVPRKGIGYGVLRHLTRHPALCGAEEASNAEISFNYLGQFDQSVGGERLFGFAPEFAGRNISPQRRREHPLSLTALVNGGTLSFTIGYNGLQYRPTSVERLAEQVIAALRAIIAHCRDNPDGHYTPSDFPLAGASQRHLSQWQQAYPGMQKLYPSTSMQQGLIFHELVDGGSYVTQLDLGLVGPLDIGLFQHAWQQLVDRHDIFRTSFVGDQLLQLVQQTARSTWQVLDWSDRDAADQAAAFEAFRAADKQRGFDITQAPLVRTALVRLSTERVRLLISYHHALMDAWSQMVLIRELMQVYHGLLGGQPPRLPDPVPYSAYVSWLHEQDQAAARSFWRAQLGELTCATALDIDGLLVDAGDAGARELQRVLDTDTTAALQRFAKSINVTIHTLIQGAWAYLLHRLTDRDQVVFGETVSGRPAGLAGVEDIVGLFIRTLPVRVDCAGDPALVPWLQELHRQSVEREAHGHLPLLEIQALSGVGESAPLFDTLLAFNNIGVDDSLRHGTGNALAIVEVQGDEQTNYALTLSVHLHEQLRFHLSYRAERHSAAMLEPLLGYLQTVLGRMAAGDVDTLQQLPVHGADDAQRLQDWSARGAGQAPDLCGEPGQLYVLDRRMRPLPPGLTGELYIAERALAATRAGQPEWRAEHFVADPFSAPADRRLYRSGELARWLPDGRLQRRGRLADRVRIGGLEFGLAEVVDALHQHPAVAQAYLRCAGDRLVAYVVPVDWPQAEERLLAEIRHWLRGRVDRPMIPAGMKLLRALPRQADGEVDPRALPAPLWLHAPSYVAPQTEHERELALLWQELLDVERVGGADNFFTLGGNSLTAVRLEFAIQEQFDAVVSIRELFEHAELAAQARLVATRARQGKMPSIVPLERSGQRLPLSFAQQRLWFMEQFEPGNSQYNMPMAFRLRGALDRAALQFALDRIVARHEVLRTVYPACVDAEPEQRIEAAAAVAIATDDLRGLDAAAQAQRAEALAAQEATAPFALDRDLMLRVRLLQLGDDDHLLLLTMHHIASDGWSMGVLLDEFVALYTAFVDGRTDPLPALPLQYVDFAHWQRGWLQGDVLAEQVAYWKTQLAGLPPLHALPLDKPRPHVQSFAGAVHTRPLDRALTDRLLALGQAQGTTLFMTLQAAFAALLSRYSRESDIVMGTPIANRAHAELAPLIGFFVNTLVLRTDLTGNPSFVELLQRARKTALDAYQHQHVPFETLVLELQPERSFSHSPLFQVMFALQNARQSTPGIPGLDLRAVESPQRVAKFDLSLAIDEFEHGLLLSWEFCQDLFELESIAAMAESFEQLLQAMVADPDSRIGSVSLLTERRRTQLLTEWCGAGGDSFDRECVHGLFEAQAAARPEAIAISGDGQSLSYGEFNTRANRLAHHLIAQGLGPEQLVGLCAERSIDTFVAMIAILKAGAAYLPLDPAYPEQRLRYMLDDAGAAWLITQSHLRDKLAFPQERITCLDQLPSGFATLSGDNPLPGENGPHAGSLAHMIYTSGSTGTPKGVMMIHRNVLAYCRAIEHDFELHPVETMLQFSSLSFDMLTEEVCISLLRGGCLVLRNEELMAGPERFCEFVLANRLTAASLPTVFWHQLCAEPAGLEALNRSELHLLVIGGEAMSKAALKQWQSVVSPKIKLLNSYGPTEATVGASIYDTGTWPGGDHGVPIGRPNGHVQLYVLNDAGQLATVGELGELHIGGSGVARGYYRRPELTAERFVAHPWSDRADACLYRTGDLVRWRRDGQLDYVGRIDNQVKVRGFRVEPGEVESVLSRHPAVVDVVVVVRDQPARLVAYLVAAAGQSADLAAEWRAWLRDQLPDYMIPAAFVLLDALPQTPNGKLDRQALPAPGLSSLSSSRYQPPATATEAQVCAIWQTLLEVERVGVHDNFFESGGHSLLATRMVSQLRRQFAIDIPLRELFNLQTVAALSAYIDAEVELSQALRIGESALADTGEQQENEVWEL